MDASLLIDYKGNITEVNCRPIMTIGRDKKNDVVIHDSEVSRSHAIIRVLGENDYYFMDTGSSNGSFINKKRVSTPTVLHHDDKIRMGDTNITFRQANKVTSTSEFAEPSTVIRQATTKIEQITILVADIRGYTSLSEQVQINTLSRLMSKWFQQVHQCILDNSGTVDKFIGDCVYARWSDGKTNRNSVIAALKSALMINNITQQLNEEFPDIKTPLRIGAGINTGNAALGLTNDDTAVGDAVNTAFRLESATKELGKDLVLSADAYNCIPSILWQDRTDEIRVKGKNTPVQIWGLMYDEIEEILEQTQ